MMTINNVREYNEAIKKIDDLLLKVGENHTYDNPEFVMLDRLSDLVADYEDNHYRIETPALIEVIKLRMYEKGLKQTDLAEKLKVPKTRVSEYLNGRRDITIDVARKLHRELNIDGDIILQ